MRPFNQRERKIIEIISNVGIDNTDTFSKILQEKYFTEERGRILIINHVTKDVLLFLRIEDFNIISQRTKAIGELWELISLVSYLIDERLLTVLDMQSNSQIDFLYQGFSRGINSSPASITFQDKDGTTSLILPDKITKSDGSISFKSVSFRDLYEPINKKLSGLIYPTEGLIFLVNNKYTTSEDLKFNKQNIISWVSIFIAFLIGLISIILSINSSQSSSKATENQTKIIEDFKIDQTKISMEELKTIKEFQTKIEHISKIDSVIQIKNK